MPTPAALATDSAVAVLIAPGLEEVEALAPVDILYRAGIRVDLVSVTDSPTVTSSHQIVLTCNHRPACRRHPPAPASIRRHPPAGPQTSTTDEQWSTLIVCTSGKRP